eukprot:SAG31_NODE_30356_length_382_cov_0.908127_1_plen_60_part_01
MGRLAEGERQYPDVAASRASKLAGSFPQLIAAASGPSYIHQVPRRASAGARGSAGPAADV